MNNEYVLFCLKEAAEDLQHAISKVEEDNFHGFEAWLPFVYRKLNRAWNCRDMDDEACKHESNQEFEENCRFPDDYLVERVSDAPPCRSP